MQPGEAPRTRHFRSPRLRASRRRIYKTRCRSPQHHDIANIWLEYWATGPLQASAAVRVRPPQESSPGRRAERAAARHRSDSHIQDKSAYARPTSPGIADKACLQRSQPALWEALVVGPVLVPEHPLQHASHNFGRTRSQKGWRDHSFRRPLPAVELATPRRVKMLRYYSVQ